MSQQQNTQEPVAHQFQDRDGKWSSFINQRHYENTVADGTWPIRALYALPPDAAARIAELEKHRDTLLAVLERMEIAFAPLAKDSTLANLIDESRAAIASVKEQA